MGVRDGETGRRMQRTWRVTVTQKFEAQGIDTSYSFTKNSSIVRLLGRSEVLPTWRGVFVNVGRGRHRRPTVWGGGGVVERAEMYY